MVQDRAAASELGVEEGLDGGAGELEDELDEDYEQQQLEPPRSVNEAVTELVPHVNGHKVQTEDDGQHQAPGAAARQEYAHVGPLKVGEDVGDNLSCRIEGAGSEENTQE